MEYIRGWVGMGILVLGIVTMFIEKTRAVSFLLAGFGIGMMASGFR